jgi:hypothetical protein
MTTAISDLVTELGFALGKVDDAIDSSDLIRARIEIDKASLKFQSLAKACNADNPWNQSRN